MSGSDGKSVSEEQFLKQFQSRFVCLTSVTMTDDMSVKGSKTIRKLDVNEIVEALEDPVKDDSVALERVKVRAEKDGKEGYVTLSGNQGTSYLMNYSPFVERLRQAEQALQETEDVIKNASRFFESKNEELRTARSGPLVNTRQELQKVRIRVEKVKSSHAQLKRKVADTHKEHLANLEAEKKRRQSAVERSAAAQMMEQANEKTNALQEQVDKVVPEAETLLKAGGADEANPLQATAAAIKNLEVVLEAIVAGQEHLKKDLQETRTNNKGPFAEARSTLVKIQVRLGALETKVRKQVTAISTMHQQVASNARMAVKNCLRHYAMTEGLSPEQLFEKLSNGKDDIAKEAMHDFLSKIPNTDLKVDYIDLCLAPCGASISKLSIFDLFQDYLTCVKEITMTAEFEVKGSKPLRKLSVGEVVEVLEPEKVEESSSMPRIRCRALLDQLDGWATVRGNHGTSFLYASAKPFQCCMQELQMQSSFESNSSAVCQLLPGEVLEVLEGPRQESSPERERVRGKAVKDGKTGWITVKDSQGNFNMEPVKLLVCRQSIAITNAFDIGGSKPIRKLEVGEVLEMLEACQEDNVRSLKRVKARTKRDSKEGWVTLTGNQGTTYAEESDRYCICRQSIEMENRFGAGGDVLRVIEVGEVVEVYEGPRKEVKVGANRVKGRNLSTGLAGWFTVTEKNVQPWSPSHKCSSSVPLKSSMDDNSAVTRTLEPGEALQALDTPVLDKSSGAVRMRVRANKDDAVGFVTVRSSAGVVHLTPVVHGS